MCRYPLQIDFCVNQFHTLSLHTPRRDRINGNPACPQVDTQVFDHGFHGCPTSGVDGASGAPVIAAV